MVWHKVWSKYLGNEVSRVHLHICKEDKERKMRWKVEEEMKKKIKVFFAWNTMYLIF